MRFGQPLPVRRVAASLCRAANCGGNVANQSVVLGWQFSATEREPRCRKTALLLYLPFFPID